MTSSSAVPRISTLRRLLRAPSAPPAERCELCRAELPQAHGHVVDTVSRRLLCACGTCGGTFEGTPDSQAACATGSRYRVVPRRYVHDASMTLSDGEWQSLGIPVGLAFFFFNSGQARPVACYPGPAGPTESLLPLDAWSTLAGARPWIQTMAPDIEALLVRHVDDRRLCFIVPIDACYELVGRIRAHWTGLSGGDRVRAEIDAFFDGLAARSHRRNTEEPQKKHRRNTEENTEAIGLKTARSPQVGEAS